MSSHRPTLDQRPVAELREILRATEQQFGADSESAHLVRQALVTAEARELREKRRKAREEAANA